MQRSAKIYDDSNDAGSDKVTFQGSPRPVPPFVLPTSVTSLTIAMISDDGGRPSLVGDGGTTTLLTLHCMLKMMVLMMTLE